jgi:hypothetical protein
MNIFEQAIHRDIEEPSAQPGSTIHRIGLIALGVSR